MRTVLALALAVLLVLAGCNAPVGDDPPDPATTGTATEPATTTSTDPATTDSTTDGTPTARTPRPDPPEDRLGWENGYWHDDPVAVDADDGLNGTEVEALVARAMARVEVIRELEFEDGAVDLAFVPPEQARETLTVDDPGQDYRDYQNGTYQAAMLVGTDRDAVDVVDGYFGTVPAWYEPGEGRVVFARDDGTVRIPPRVLAHELAHALQDQHLYDPPVVSRTHDESLAARSVWEGEATLVEELFVDRCRDRWDCLDTDLPGLSGDVHYGIVFVQSFPYDDGAEFVRHHYERGGWAAVDRLYEDPPATSAEVIEPGADDPPSEVDLPETATGDWEPVHPEGPAGSWYAPDDANSVGRATLSVAFSYTLEDDYNDSSVVSSRDAYDRGWPDRLEYDFEYTEGWAGDRLRVYRNDGDVAYVWRLAWESPGDAATFREGYRRLLAHWGGSPVGNRSNVWRIPEDSPFTGAYYVEVDGDTVTIAKAPTVDGLADVYREEAGSVRLPFRDRGSPATGATGKE